MHRCATALDNVTVTSALVVPTVQTEVAIIAIQHTQLVQNYGYIVFLLPVVFCIAFYIFAAGEHREFKFGVQVDYSKSLPMDDKLSLKGAWSCHL